MGLAVLPSRLKKEMDILAKAIIEGENIHDIEEINCQYYKNWKCKLKGVACECYWYMRTKLME